MQAEQVPPGPPPPPPGPTAPGRPARTQLPKLHTYRYTLATALGVRLKGKIRAFTAEEAAGLVSQPGAHVEKIRKSADFLSVQVGGRAVKRSELVIFTRQLSAFVRAGVPMIDGLATIGGENASRGLQDTLRLVCVDLSQGVSLSEAMGRHPRVFPPFYVDLVRAGEITGRLDDVLKKAAHYLERQDEAARKIRGALAYPGVIAAVAALTVAVIVTFVLPKFVDFFASFDAKLPAPTRALIATSDWLGDWWWAVLGGVVLLVAGWLVWIRTEGGARFKDRLMLRIPGLGQIVRYAVIERFCHTLATMVSAGVPLVQTFSVIIDGTKNRVFQAGLRRVQEQMMVGQGMSGPIAATGLFPGIVPQMVRVGEESGSLDDQLTLAAEFFATELDERIKRFTTYFEPAVIVLMGLVVGFVAVALISAMYGIYSQIGVKK